MAPRKGARLDADESAPRLNADEVQPGAKCCIVGLKNATHLNGQLGIIHSKQDERWAVKLDASGERVLVRGANLKVRVEYQPVLQGCGAEKANGDGAGTSREINGADPPGKLPAGSEREPSSRLPRFNAHKPLVPQIIGLRKQVRIDVPTPTFQRLTHRQAAPHPHPHAHPHPHPHPHPHQSRCLRAGA